MSSRHKQLGLTQAIVTESITIMENALSGGKHLTREALIIELKQAKIAVDENRASHLLARAELDGILCSGATQKGKQTYALLEERVPKSQTLSKEESLARLAQIYFSSRGPATIQDFAWWSGLTLTACRQALEMVKGGFISETIDSKNYWFPNSQGSARQDDQQVYLMPAYDEFTICYADRSAVVPSEGKTRLISENGIFRPILVVNGRVQGIWKRTFKKEQVLVEIAFFTTPDKKTMESIEKAVMEYGVFLGKTPEIIQA